MKKYIKLLLFLIYISIFLLHCLKPRLFGFNMPIYDYFLEFSNFIPFVYFLNPIVKEKKHIYVFCLFIIIGFEFCQILFKSGSFDIDDIMLNFLGVVIAKQIYDKIQTSRTATY